MKIDHLSASQLGMYVRCPAQYQFRYVQGLKRPPKGRMVQGKAYHTSVETNYLQKIDSRADLKVDDLKDIFSTALDTAFAAEEVDLEEGQGKGELKDEGVQIVDLFSREIAPKVQPVRVEQKENFIVEVGGQPVTITTVIDCVDSDARIIDQKVKRKTPLQTEFDKDLQATIYSMFWRSKGNLEKCLAWDVALVLKAGIRHLRLITLRNEAHHQWVLNRVITPAVAAIQAEIFPANDSGWWCSPEWCGYHDICKKGTTVSII